MERRAEVAWIIGAGVPGGLALAGWMVGFEVSLDLAIVIVLVSAVAAGVVRGTDTPMRMAFCAAFTIIGAGTVAAVDWYTRGRSTIIKWELLIPAAIGMLPGAIVYFVVADREKRRTQRDTTSVVAKTSTSSHAGLIWFAARSADVTTAGIEARREDGSVVLVLWRDVGAMIARSLPADLDGAPFLDIVSVPGATVRILPWTKVIGVPSLEDGERRLHAIVRAFATHCPNAKLDDSFLSFDRAALAEHDRTVDRLPGKTD